MKKIINLLINIYKIFFSLFIKSVFGGGCRYNPTCSDYAKVAISKNGVIKGSIMSVGRVLKCNPFSGSKKGIN